MSISSITKHLLKELKEFGAIDWHESRHNSRYIKFRDTRLGSIRIADHKGRSKYSYTYELSDISTEEDISKVIESIKLKSKTIPDFNPKSYIVYIPWQKLYTKVPNFETYKNHILKKGINMQYLLTEEEYEALTAGSPDALLRETNNTLKTKLDECQAKLNQTPSVIESKFDSPFIATGSKLSLRSYMAFITLFNSLAQPTLNDSDKAVYDYLTTLASLFNYESQFESQKDLKAYRVSLQKKDLINQIVKDGKRYLEYTDAKF